MLLNRKTLTRAEVEKISLECCLSEELVSILYKLAHGDTLVKISMDMGMSVATAERKIKIIKGKMSKI